MPRWVVVGGADKGGILVRQGQALSSPQVEPRLSTGATVEEIELVGERLRYCLIAGSGPSEGWVSLKVSGKDLVVPQEEEREEAVESVPAEAPEFEELGDDYPFLNSGTTATGKSPWLKSIGKSKEDAKARLVIFSWTGNRGGQGSAHNFMKPASPAWSELLSAFDLFEVSYPGRGTRLKDPLYEDCTAYVQDIAAALQGVLAGGKPVAFLGFAFGAVLAFECARLLQEHGLGPVCLAAASAESPRWPGRAKMGLAKLSEAAFERMLHDKGGTDFILQDASMKKMFVPVITADCKLEERYRYNPSRGALKCPVLVYYGTKVGHDKMQTVITAEAANAWLEVTACKRLSTVEALDSDWYIFQDPGATEAVAKGVAAYCAPRIG